MTVANIDLPYIEKNPSRHGKPRYYLRIDGKRIARLPDDIRSEEFTTAYWRCRNAHEDSRKPPHEARGVRIAAPSLVVQPNTFRWLCGLYMASDDFTGLDPTTQAKRRSIMESMWLEPVTPNSDDRLFADMPLRVMDAANIEVLKKRKQATPFAADERLKILRQVFDTKDGDGKPIVPNVAKLVEPYRKRTDGHATATPDDLSKFIAHHGIHSSAVFCIVLAMYTGLRVSDLAILGPQHRRNGAFRLRLFKNRNRTPVDIELFIHPVLAGVLDQRPVTGMTYLMSPYGRPYTVKGLGNRISDWFTQAGLPHLSAHSIRKGLATDIAHNEATDKMLDSMFGWSSPRTSATYTKAAEKARLSRQAVLKIKWDGIGDALLLPQGVATGLKTALNNGDNS